MEVPGCNVEGSPVYRLKVALDADLRQARIGANGLSRQLHFDPPNRGDARVSSSSFAHGNDRPVFCSLGDVTVECWTSGAVFVFRNRDDAAAPPSSSARLPRDAAVPPPSFVSSSLDVSEAALIPPEEAMDAELPPPPPVGAVAPPPIACHLHSSSPESLTLHLLLPNLMLLSVMLSRETLAPTAGSRLFRVSNDVVAPSDVSAAFLTPNMLLFSSAPAGMWLCTLNPTASVDASSAACDVRPLSPRGSSAMFSIIGGIKSVVGFASKLLGGGANPDAAITTGINPSPGAPGDEAVDYPRPRQQQQQQQQRPATPGPPPPPDAADSAPSSSFQPSLTALCAIPTAEDEPYAYAVTVHDDGGVRLWVFPVVNSPNAGRLEVGAPAGARPVKAIRVYRLRCPVAPDADGDGSAAADTYADPPLPPSDLWSPDEHACKVCGWASPPNFLASSASASSSSRSFLVAVSAHTFVSVGVASLYLLGGRLPRDDVSDADPPAASDPRHTLAMDLKVYGAGAASPAPAAAAAPSSSSGARQRGAAELVVPDNVGVAPGLLFATASSDPKAFPSLYAVYRGRESPNNPQTPAARQAARQSQQQQQQQQPAGAVPAAVIAVYPPSRAINNQCLPHSLRLCASPLPPAKFKPLDAVTAEMQSLEDELETTASAVAVAASSLDDLYDTIDAQYLRALFHPTSPTAPIWRNLSSLRSALARSVSTVPAKPRSQEDPERELKNQLLNGVRTWSRGDDGPHRSAPHTALTALGGDQASAATAMDVDGASNVFTNDNLAKVRAHHERWRRVLKSVREEARALRVPVSLQLLGQRVTVVRRGGLRSFLAYNPSQAPLPTSEFEKLDAIALDVLRACPPQDVHKIEALLEAATLSGSLSAAKLPEDLARSMTEVGLTVISSSKHPELNEIARNITPDKVKAWVKSPTLFDLAQFGQPSGNITTELLSHNFVPAGVSANEHPWSSTVKYVISLSMHESRKRRLARAVIILGLRKFTQNLVSEEVEAASLFFLTRACALQFVAAQPVRGPAKATVLDRFAVSFLSKEDFPNAIHAGCRAARAFGDENAGLIASGEGTDGRLALRLLAPFVAFPQMSLSLPRDERLSPEARCDLLGTVTECLLIEAGVAHTDVAKSIRRRAVALHRTAIKDCVNAHVFDDDTRKTQAKAACAFLMEKAASEGENTIESASITELSREIATNLRINAKWGTRIAELKIVGKSLIAWGGVNSHESFEKLKRDIAHSGGDISALLEIFLRLEWHSDCLGKVKVRCGQSDLELSLECTEDAISVLNELPNKFVERASEIATIGDMSESSTLWTSKFDFSLQLAATGSHWQGWKEAYDACMLFKNVDKTIRLERFSKLCQAMCQSGALLELISFPLGVFDVKGGDDVQGENEVDFYREACLAIKEAATAASESGDEAALIDYQSCLFALHASRDDWKRAAMVANRSGNHQLCLKSIELVKEADQQFIFDEEGLNRGGQFGGGSAVVSRAIKKRHVVGAAGEDFRAVGVEATVDKRRTNRLKTLSDLRKRAALTTSWKTLSKRDLSVDDTFDALCEGGFFDEAISLAKIHYTFDPDDGSSGEDATKFGKMLVRLVLGHLYPATLKPSKDLQLFKVTVGSHSTASYVKSLSANADATRSGSVKSAAFDLLETVVTREGNAKNGLALALATEILNTPTRRLPEWLTRLLTGSGESGVNRIGLFATVGAAKYHPSELQADPAGLLRLYMKIGDFVSALQLVGEVLTCGGNMKVREESARLAPEMGGIHFVPYNTIDVLFELVDERIAKRGAGSRELQEARKFCEVALKDHFKCMFDAEEGKQARSMLKK